MDSKKKCRACGVELNKDNWWPSFKKYWQYVCKDCEKERHRKRKRTPEFKARMSFYHRQNRLRVNGKRMTVRKRLFYGICELCGEPIEANPQWHHWDDAKPELGIWVHNGRCHRICDAVEKDPKLQEHFLYLKIRELIENGK